MRGGDYFILSCTLLLFSTPSWALQTGGVPDIHTEFTDRQGRPTDPVTLDFGCREVGSPRLEFSFSLENRTPGSELTLFSVSNRDPSFIVTTQQTFPVRVSSGNAVRVSVSFVPQGTGLIEDRVSIRSNDPDEPEFVVHMNGIGSDSSSPCADFRWAPAVPSVGEEVQFFDNSKFAPIKAWDFDGDGSVDSTEESPLHVFDASGFHPVMLTASSESGGSVSATHTLRVESVGPPSIRFVSREFEGLFVEGVDSAIPQNRFTPDVRWNGSTGELRYSINDGPQTSSCCSMSEFPARFSPSQVTITAVRDGLSSDPWKEEVHVFPFPTWVTRAGLADLDFESSGETVITHFRSEVPRPRLGGFLLDIPAEVPLLGGQFGVAESFAGLDGTFYSGTGTGFFRLSGATAFQAMGDRVEGRAWGGGSFKIGASTGLEATSGALSFSLAGTITRTQGIAEVIPKLRELENRKVIGKAIKAFNEIVTLEGQISPSMRLDTQFAQHGENLEFNEGEGALGLGLKTTVRAEVLNVTAEAWLGGHGEITLGVPEPFLRKVELAAQAGVSINIDFLISAVEEDATVNLRCSWEPGRGNQMDCRFGSGASSAMLTAMGQDELLLKVIRVNYDRFGPYAAFRPTLHPLAFNPELPYDLRQSTLVSNVFPGASPFTVEIPGAQLLLWEFQDLDDPVLQSTEIVFSLNDGSGWTT